MAITQGVGSTSSDIYKQILANQSNMDPYLAGQGTAPKFFEDKVRNLYNNNQPAIKNAAGLEARAYSLPKELTEQYDAEYGGKTGIGSMSRMNSILQNIGNQFGISNAAWNMVDQAKVRQSDLANTMLQQYTGELDALKSKNSMLMPLWQQMYASENQYRGGGGGAKVEDFDPNDLGTGETEETTTPENVDKRSDLLKKTDFWAKGIAKTAQKAGWDAPAKAVQDYYLPARKWIQGAANIFN